jgi:uncharacterized Tic20 family protein
MNDELPVASSQDSRNMALLVWIATIFLAFVPGLIVYLVKKDDPFLLDQGKESLNWSITAGIIYFVGMLLTVVLIGIFVMWAIGVVHLIICVLGAISCSNGNAYRAPFALRLIR